MIEEDIGILSEKGQHGLSRGVKYLVPEEYRILQSVGVENSCLLV